MIGLIHNIGENGIDIKNERFIGDISFLNEVVREYFTILVLDTNATIHAPLVKPKLTKMQILLRLE